MAFLTSGEFESVAGGGLDPAVCSRILDEITFHKGIIATEIIEGFFCTFSDGWIVAARLSDGNFATYIEAKDVDGIADSPSEKQATDFICYQLESSEMLSHSEGGGRFSKETDLQIRRWQKARRLVWEEGIDPEEAEIMAALLL